MKAKKLDMLKIRCTKPCLFLNPKW